MVRFSSNSVDTLRGSHGRCQAPVLDRCVARACALLFAIHSCLSKSSTCISTQAREIWVAGAGACRDCALVVAPCGFSHTVVTFRGRRKGNLVL